MLQASTMTLEGTIIQIREREWEGPERDANQIWDQSGDSIRYWWDKHQVDAIHKDWGHIRNVHWRWKSDGFYYLELGSWRGLKQPSWGRAMLQPTTIGVHVKDGNALDDDEWVINFSRWLKWGLSHNKQSIAEWLSNRAQGYSLQSHETQMFTIETAKVSIVGTKICTRGAIQQRKKMQW